MNLKCVENASPEVDVLHRTINNTIVPASLEIVRA